MFPMGRRHSMLALVLLTGCSRCCMTAIPEEVPTDVKPVGPNSAPMAGGSISRNMANTVEKGIPSEWNLAKGKEKNVKWVARLGDHAYSAIVVAGGRVFVGTNNERPRAPAITGDKGVLMCFRESDGAFLWQILHDKQDPSETDFDKIGIVSAPVVEGDRLYYVSNRCELVCADVAGDPKALGKGKIVWLYDMRKELKVYPGALGGSIPSSNPLIVGDLVYALTSNGVSSSTSKVAEPKAPSLVAINKTTGKLAWSDNSPGEGILDGQWSSPVAAEANGEMLVIYGAGDGWLYAFEAKSGELRWKFDCNPKGAVYKHGGRGSRNYIVATSVVYDQKLYIATGLDTDAGDGVGHLWCVDITKKPTNKEKDLSPYSDPKDPNPTFDPKDPKNKDSGLVWHHGGLVVPKPARDREFIFGRSLSTCAIHDGLVYAVETSGFLQCLDAKTGQKYWVHDLQDTIWSSPYYVDGKVFVGTQGSAMYVFQHGKTLKEPTKIEMEGPINVGPTACNGVLFVHDDNDLYAIAEKK